MAKFWENHWYDVGGIGAIICLIILFSCLSVLSPLRLIALASLITLLCHQVEEYRWPGNVSFYLNALFKSPQPDRYPVNPANTLVIDACMLWVFYILAVIILSPILILATVMVSLSNFIAHTFVLSIRFKKFYNPGLFTGFFFFGPVGIYAIIFMAQNHIFTVYNIIWGVILGIFLILSVFFVAMILREEKTTKHFVRRGKKQKKG